MPYLSECLGRNAWPVQPPIDEYRQSLNTLLVDLHPNQPASMQAVNNLFRCELAAGSLAALDVMLRSLGAGWCFVVFAALHLVTLPLFWVMERRGLGWRQRPSLG